MFSKDGDLLMANKRGLDRYRDISELLHCNAPGMDVKPVVYLWLHYMGE